MQLGPGEGQSFPSSFAQSQLREAPGAGASLKCGSPSDSGCLATWGQEGAEEPPSSPECSSQCKSSSSWDHLLSAMGPDSGCPASDVHLASGIR